MLRPGSSNPSPERSYSNSSTSNRTTFYITISSNANCTNSIYLDSTNPNSSNEDRRLQPRQHQRNGTSCLCSDSYKSDSFNLNSYNTTATISDNYRDDSSKEPIAPTRQIVQHRQLQRQQLHCERLQRQRNQLLQPRQLSRSVGIELRGPFCQKKLERKIINPTLAAPVRTRAVVRETAGTSTKNKYTNPRVFPCSLTHSDNPSNQACCDQDELHIRNRVKTRTTVVSVVHCSRATAECCTHHHTVHCTVFSYFPQ